MRKTISIVFLISLFFMGNATPAINELPDQLQVAKKVDQFFADDGNVVSPGCALGVIRSGELVYSRGYGFASLEHRVAIDPQRTVFDIGSTSKQFTAAAILLLISEGKLGLDDDLRAHLPEMPDYGRKINIRDLLHHTSGLRDYTVLMTMGTGVHEVDYRSAEDAIALITRQKALNFMPGTHFMYSNTNYFLLARIVERVSGKPFSQFMQERIFVPLGMENTRVATHYDSVVPHLASAYKRAASGGFALFMTNWEHIGESRVLSTVADLVKWDRNFYTPKIGGTWLIDQMQVKGKRSDGVVLGYAGGLFVDRFGGHEAVSHAGNTAGYSAEVFRLPTKKFTVVLLCNNNNEQVSNLARKVAHLYLGDQLNFAPSAALTSAPMGANPQARLTHFAGTFVERYNQSVRQVEEKDGKLWYVRNERSRSALASLGGDQFQVVGSTNKLHFSPSGGQMRFVSLEGEPAEFEKVKVPTAETTAGDIVDFAGTYVSEEIGTTWTIFARDGALVVRPVRSPEIPMTLLFVDGFRAGTELLRFSRNSTGRITGFSADNIRVLGLRFQKLETADTNLTTRRKSSARLRKNRS